jgi:hypothetical protein
VDEINLNSDEEEPKDSANDAGPKLELRSEPEDIFEDIPEPKEVRTEAVPQTVFGSIEPSVTSPRPQVGFTMFMAAT